MNALTEKLVALYLLFVRIVSALQSPFLLFVRLYWGWQFTQAGWGKLGNIQHVIGFFTTLGIPFPAFNAYFVSSMEVVGGALLFIGLGSRLFALPLAFDMVVAYVAGDREAVMSFFSDPGKFYNADPFTFLMAALIVLIFGPGMFALDTLIERWWKKRHGSA